MSDDSSSAILPFGIPGPDINSLPAHVDNLKVSATETVVTAHVSRVDEEHEYSYEIPANVDAIFRFKHRGKFNLTPIYDPSPVVDDNNEGSARAHGETSSATDVIHSSGIKRTVKWQIRYRGGHQNRPYTLTIRRA